MTTLAQQKAAVRIMSVSKAFGATRALDDVSFDIAKGTVHALIGGNGSGKSTLIKVLAGVHEADAGEIGVRGEVLDATTITPMKSRDHGLRFVHQQTSVFPSLTVMENLAIGRGFEDGGVGQIKWREQRRRAREVLARFEIDKDPDVLLAELSPASQTMVAIARALQDQEADADGVLVLDEPTSSLPAHEVRLLLAALRRYAAAGQTILYVSHRLEEVCEVADAVTVLRDGHIINTLDGVATPEDLAELMTGRPVEALTFVSAASGSHDGAPAVQVADLVAGACRGISFQVRPGEIVGIAGLLGSGRTSLLKALFGDVPLESGTITMNGEALGPLTPTRAMERGIALVPEDRAGQAVFSAMSVTTNLGMAVTPEFFVRGTLRHRREEAAAERLVSKYFIKCSSVGQPISSLSGGNAQKVILSRWLRRKPRLLLLDEPTQGVDVSARFEIWEIVRAALEEGTAVLVVSSDAEELAGVCNRVLVMRNGHLAGELSGGDVTPHNIDRISIIGASA